MSSNDSQSDRRERDAAPSGFLFVEGVLLLLFGLAAVVFPIFASIAAAVLLGWLLIATGIAGLIGAFSARPHLHFGWSLVSSVVSIIAGLLAAFYPLAGVLALVLLIAAWLVLDGVSSMMIALDQRRSGGKTWGWTALSAVMDWLLAIGVFVFAPLGGPVIVGIVVGVSLIFGGGALLMVGTRAASGRGAQAGQSPP
jgi:uncharacterized membrane protein HdeD (DUF308 family)